MRSIIFCSLTILFLPVEGIIYQCKDSDGKIFYQQTVCPPYTVEIQAIYEAPKLNDKLSKQEEKILQKQKKQISMEQKKAKTIQDRQEKLRQKDQRQVKRLQSKCALLSDKISYIQKRLQAGYTIKQEISLLEQLHDYQRRYRESCMED